MLLQCCIVTVMPIQLTVVVIVIVVVSCRKFQHSGNAFLQLFLKASRFNSMLRCSSVYFPLLTSKSWLLIFAQISPVPEGESRTFTLFSGYCTWPITCWRENRSNSQTVNSSVLFGRSSGDTQNTKSSKKTGLEVLRWTLDWTLRFLSGRRKILTYGVTVTFSPIGVNRVARKRQTINSSLFLS